MHAASPADPSNRPWTCLPDAVYCSLDLFVNLLLLEQHLLMYVAACALQPASWTLLKGLSCLKACVLIAAPLLLHQAFCSLAGGAFALMSFNSLCGQPVAAADYIALAEEFHTIAIEDIPVFTAAARPQAYRCVTLVDVLYEHRIRLFASSEATPMDLFKHVMSQADAKSKVRPYVAVACGDTCCIYRMDD